MNDIKEFIMLRKMFGITSIRVADEMETTKQTVSNLELEKAQNNMTMKFYKMTVLELIRKCDDSQKEEVKKNLKNILKYLQDEA